MIFTLAENEKFATTRTLHAWPHIFALRQEHPMQDENSIRVVESTVGMMAHWAPSFGDRAFYFDAFLSHNANDQFAQNVAEMLQQLDVRIWGDANGDMSSRRVTGRITHALYSSRYVVVCVSSTYRDSPWMKAEYLNALKIEAQAPGSRVIVVCPDNYAANTNVPEALRHAPTYIVSNNTDAALLASCVSSGNRLPAGMVSRPGKRQEGPNGSALRSVRQRFRPDGSKFGR
ncbi:MAG: hypothetical protein DMF53_04685 [Acidobacteria bacterium]|nr:MAG: hypothetical protein DMF53_04685 [Acidobacteriota bacterium]